MLESLLVVTLIASLPIFTTALLLAIPLWMLLKGLQESPGMMILGLLLILILELS